MFRSFVPGLVLLIGATKSNLRLVGTSVGLKGTWERLSCKLRLDATSPEHRTFGGYNSELRSAAIYIVLMAA